MTLRCYAFLQKHFFLILNRIQVIFNPWINYGTVILLTFRLSLFFYDMLSYFFPPWVTFEQA